MTHKTERYLIREAVPEDWSRIVEFNRRLAEETEDVALDLSVLKGGVQAALADPGKARYFVAIAELEADQIVGQVMHTWEWSDWRNGTIWWLQSVYVAAEHRGRGVFRKLFEHLRLRAEADPTVVGIRLYVEHENEPARGVYRRLGMVPGGYEVMERVWTR